MTRASQWILALALVLPTAALARAERRARPPSAFRLRFLELSADPSHGGKRTTGSRREAWVGLRLEKAGVLRGPIRREGSGSAEFIDAAGVRWDVKAFHSERAAEDGGFVLERAIAKLAKELAAGQNVILDDRALSGEHANLLDQVIQQKQWAQRVHWYRGR